ncbi:MAG: HlyD family efflux transporter periplasmic adaptor subunit [Candidatus Margulisiibacteriota bacterium]
MKNLYLVCICACLLIFPACKKTEIEHYDGRADVEIKRITSTATGKIEHIFFDKGVKIPKEFLLVKIDSQKLAVQKKQKELLLKELNLNIENLEINKQELCQELNFKESLLKKTMRMLKDGAATTNNKEELAANVAILKLKITEIANQKLTLKNKKALLEKDVVLLNLQINDTEIHSPIKAIVLNKYVNEGEFVPAGFLLADIADLNLLKVRIYVPLAELPEIYLGKKVWLIAEGVKEKFQGKVSWISSEAEFTPKTIITKETRTSLVYAVEITVPNIADQLKIGVPVDVYLEI